MTIKGYYRDGLVRYEVRLSEDIAQLLEDLCAEITITKAGFLKMVIMLGLTHVEPLMGQRESVMWRQIADQFQKIADYKRARTL